jgi:hypothetical protein
VVRRDLGHRDHDHEGRVKKQEALFIAMCAGAIAFAFAFIAPMLSGGAVPWYYPIEHRWTFEARPNGFALDFFGRTLFGLAAWAIAVLVALPLARRAKSISARVLGLVTAWTVTAVLLVMLHYAWSLHFRRPLPEPMPTWYQPR